MLMWWSALVWAGPMDDPTVWHDRMVEGLENDDSGCWDVQGTVQASETWNTSAGPGRPSFAEPGGDVSVPFTARYQGGTWSGFELQPDSGTDPGSIEDIDAPGSGRGWLGLGAPEEMGTLLKEQVESWWVEPVPGGSDVRYAGEIDVDIDVQSLRDSFADDDQGRRWAGALRVSDASVQMVSTFAEGASRPASVRWTLTRPVRVGWGLFPIARLHRGSRELRFRMEGDAQVPVSESFSVQMSMLGSTVRQRRVYRVDRLTPCASVTPRP